MATSTKKQVQIDLSPLLKQYTDGTIERLITFPYAPPSPDDPTVSSKDIAISPSLSARLYLPKPLPSSQTLPILLNFHGGGFCLGSAFSSLDHHYMTKLCSQSKSLIISIEYRLAPEHPLPAAYEDSWTSLTWLCSQFLDHNRQKEPWIVDHGDLTRIFVGGDSAGGNIAYNLAMRAGSDKLPGNAKLFGALLSHPAFWGSKSIGSGERRGDLGEHMLDRMWAFVYPDAPGGVDDPMMNPVDGEQGLGGLGCEQVMVCLSEKDVLTEWGFAFVEKLKGSGWKGEVQVVVVQGEDHCFHVFDLQAEKAKDLITKMANFISH